MCMAGWARCENPAYPISRVQQTDPPTYQHTEKPNPPTTHSALPVLALCRVNTTRTNSHGGRSLWTWEYKAKWRS